MPEKDLVRRGPMSYGAASEEVQLYYVQDRQYAALQIGRKIALTRKEGRIVAVSCTCTANATLQNPCSHIRTVFEFINAAALLPPLPVQKRASKPKRTAQIAKTRSIKDTTANQPSLDIDVKVDDISKLQPVIEAIRDEITAIQSSQSARRFGVTNGKLNGRLGESFRYRFDLSDEFRPPAETPIEILVRNASAPIMGSVLRCEPESFIELALDGYQGEFIPEAQLISRMDFIWKAAEKRLTQILADKSSDLLKTFLRPVCAPIYDNSLHGGWESFEPDSEQKNALAICLAQKITFVYGPPGTGKSQVIGWLTKELIERGQKTLIASHTNIAVDNALQKICETKEGQALRASGEIVRLGEPTTESLSDLRLPEIIRVKSHGLAERQAALRLELGQAHADKNSIHEKVAILENFRSSVKDRQRLLQDLRSTRARALQIASQRRIWKKKIIVLEKQLGQRGVLDIVLWMFRRNQARQARTQLDRREASLRAFVARATEDRKHLRTTEAFLKKNRIPLDSDAYSAKLQGLAEKEALATERISQLATEISILQGKLDEIAQNIYSQTRIIGATLSKVAMENGLSKFLPDNLLIDELSTAPFPLVLVALSLPSKRAVLFGDPHQLPPISLADTEAAKKYLRRDTYQIMRAHTEIGCSLTVQRRMPESIVEFVNSPIYGGKLRTDPHTEECRKVAITDGRESPFRNSPLKDHQVIFLDTTSLNPWCALDSNKSKYNLYSAQIVAELIAQEVGSTPRWSTPKEIAVICPYRAQKQLIKRLCMTRLGIDELPSYLDVHTIDSFQGEQRDVVILDLTSGQPASPGIRLSERIERQILGADGAQETKVRRLLNVAITRSKLQLVIIANKKYFERELQQADHEYVLEVMQRASVVGVKQHLRKYHVWIDGADLLKAQDGRRSGYSPFLDETNFYGCLKDDFRKASSSVVIVSPFITSNRVRDLSTDIQAMLRRGVKVWVVTRPIDEAEFGTSALAYLGQLGCSIKQRKRTHEKIVVIDNRVAYYGSLNVLSHKDTKESMHRIEGSHVAQLLQQFVDILGFAKVGPAGASLIPTQYGLTREQCAGKLKQMRWKIATQRHTVWQAVLYNQTIEGLLDNPPSSEDELYNFLEECGEKQLQHLAPFLDEILALLARYKK